MQSEEFQNCHTDTGTGVFSLADTPQNADDIHRAYIHFLIFLHLFRSLSVIRLYSPACVSCETLKMQQFLFLLCVCVYRPKGKSWSQAVLAEIVDESHT